MQKETEANDELEQFSDDEDEEEDNRPNTQGKPCGKAGEEPGGASKETEAATSSVNPSEAAIREKILGLVTASGNRITVKVFI